MTTQKETPADEDRGSEAAMQAALEGNNSITFKRAEEALRYIDPNIERGEWVKVGMALKSEFGEEGVDLFDTWSEEGDTYKFEDLKSTWDSISENGGIGIGTLFRMAKIGGFKPSGKPLTAEERAVYALEKEKHREQIEHAKEEKLKAELEKHEVAARNAKAMLDHSAGRAFKDHQYIVKKGIVSFVSAQIGRHEDELYIPMKDKEGKIWNIERIDSSGSKKGLTGGRRKGLFFPIKGKNGIVISEGFATAVSIHLATRMNVICAFGKNNLKAIAVLAREHNPQVRIIIAGDVGSEESAIQAAREISGEMAIPALSKRGSDFNDLHQAKGLDAVRDAIKDSIKVSQWTDIEALNTSLPDVKKFDYLMLPEGLEAYVKDESERMQCPPDYIGSALMFSAAVLIGRKIGVHPKAHDEWLVIPNLWGAAVGRPSAKKSPAINAGMKFIKALVNESRKEYSQDQQEYETEKEFQQASKKVNSDAIKSAVQSGDANKIEAARQQANALVAITAPTERRFIINDSTVEKLGELLNENTNGLGMIRDELTGWLKSMDREDKSSDRAFYLEAFNGDGSFVYDRIGRGTVHIESNTLSVFGGIQPARLRPYIYGAINQNQCDDGLIQRLQLLVYPDESKTYMHVDRRPDRNARDKAEEVFRKLQDIPPKRDDYDQVAGVRFDPAGQKLFDDWYVGNENRIKADDMHPALASHFGKYGSLLASLALIINEIEVGHYQTIAETSVRKALMWIRYLESHALRIYGDVVSPVIHAAELILKKQSRLSDGFTKRELVRKQWSGLTKTSLIEDALDELVECGYLKRKQLPTKGRSALAYFWNPNA